MLGVVVRIGNRDRLLHRRRKTLEQGDLRIVFAGRLAMLQPRSVWIRSARTRTPVRVVRVLAAMQCRTIRICARRPRTGAARATRTGAGIVAALAMQRRAIRIDTSRA